MNIEECKFYNKETGCIECKQVVVKNLVDIISWQREKLEKIEPLAIGLKQTDYQHIRQVGEKMLQIIRGEE